MTIISLPRMPTFIMRVEPAASLAITNPTLLKILGGVSLSSLITPETQAPAHVVTTLPSPVLYQTVGAAGTTETFLAGSGNDTLVAGAGSARHISSVGEGSTTFLFTQATAASGGIVSLGFEHGRDFIDVIGATNATINSFVSNQHATTGGTVLHLTNGSALTLVGFGPVVASDFVHLPK